MTNKTISILALFLTASPAFAQTAPQTTDPVGNLVEQRKIDSSVPGTPEILYSQQVGLGVGALQERSSTRQRGPYSFGECPDGTILTTLGTCARLNR